MNILSIESSCDETAAAVISDGGRILSNVVVSQVDIFAAYGGVIPEVAARSHLEAILPVVRQALQEAGEALGLQDDKDERSSKMLKPQNGAEEVGKQDEAEGANTSGKTRALSWPEVDYVAVTHTPGLLGSLLIGTLTARTLAILHHKPLYAVHHLKSHIYANWLVENSAGSTPVTGASTPVSKASAVARSDTTPVIGIPTPVSEASAVASSDTTPVFPLLALVVSGGHTQIIYMRGHNQFEIIGTTRDDAVGECFDKVAKILGLPYPGGPAITAAANGQVTLANKAPGEQTQDEQGQQKPQQTVQTAPGDPHKYPLPHPQVSGLDFSFSGLKTAVLRAVQKAAGVPISYPSHQLAARLTPQQVADFAASFQQTAVDILLDKLQLALASHPAKSIVIAGGVSANQLLRQEAVRRFQGAPSQETAHPPKTAKQPKDAPRRPGGLPVYFPQPKFSGDNAAMVGAAAYYEILAGVPPTDPYTLNIMPRSEIR